MLSEVHLLYPDHLPPALVAEKVRACLEGAEANRLLLLDPGMDWHNFIHRACFEYGVHPIMPLVAMQRERSLLGQPADARDYDFALGVVGQDAPGTVNERWNGLPTQIFLGVRSMAWLANIGPGANFGWRPGISPTKRRWSNTEENNVRLYTSDNREGELYRCADRAVYTQLCFTPHLEVLDTNWNIYCRWLRKHWE